MSTTLDGWLQRIEAIHPKSIDMGLDRVRQVYDALGSPRPARQIITVAGTNGKGSTVAYLEAIALANGWRVGAYTSPHLLTFNERIRVQGESVDDARLVEAFERIDAARGDTPLTYFEFATLAGLLIFAQSQLDLAVLEVGLGGRLDATNIIDSDVAVITTVDLDHQDYLGSDREQIGAEKAGVMRAWKPVVLGERDPPSSVLARAYLIGASAIRFNCDYFVDAVDGDQEFIWREPGLQLPIPVPQLKAPVQRINAATAIAAMRALPESPDNSAYAKGIGAAVLPGRLQLVSVGDVPVYLDVAHNPQAAGVLADWLLAHPISGQTLAVFGALQDKDPLGVVERLAPVVDQWWLAALDGPRGQSVEQLQKTFMGVLNASYAGGVDDALQSALAVAGPQDRILVFGSFITVAAALRRLRAVS